MNEEVDSSLGLRGWFRKEKQDKKFKKPKLSTSSNRRWFQIQKIEGELALCYYKRMPKDEGNDLPTGFFFLNDITSISQDIPKRLIMLEHPTRALRMESPSLSQHEHSYTELAKYCTNARSNSRNELPSHSFYTSAPLSTSTSVEENASMLMDGTAANDELNGNGIALSTSSSDSGILDTSVSTTESEKENVAPEYEEEKTAFEPLYYRGSGKHDDSEIFNMEQMKKELSDNTVVRQESLMSATSNDIPNRSASFGSHSHQIPTSSSFRLHFGDDDVQPDDDFLCDDWDD